MGSGAREVGEGEGRWGRERGGGGGGGGVIISQCCRGESLQGNGIQQFNFILCLSRELGTQSPYLHHTTGVSAGQELWPA